MNIIAVVTEEARLVQKYETAQTSFLTLTLSAVSPVSGPHFPQVVGNPVVGSISINPLSRRCVMIPRKIFPAISRSLESGDSFAAARSANTCPTASSLLVSVLKIHPWYS